MRKNQKYTKEEMYLAIELWKESGISQKKYCLQNHLSFNTFKYWQKKYQKDKAVHGAKASRSFIPVHIPHAITTTLPETDTVLISITYPNGVIVSCAVSIGIEQLRTLIKV